MGHTLGSGDKLARGAIKASYLVRDEKEISQEKWNEMFGDFDPKAFAAKPGTEVPVEGAIKETTVIGITK